jgi:hypothetical protein
MASVVADPFNIGDDLHCGEDLTEIGCDRLFCCNEAGALILNRSLHLVYMDVAIDDLTRKIVISVGQCYERLLMGLFHQCTHAQDILVQELHAV